MNRLEKILKNNKLRLTQPRQLIFDILEESERALSAQDVCDKVYDVEQQKADQASVYRNLSLFSKIGLVHKLESGKYSICTHQEDPAHKHMHILASCSSCGKTYEIESHSKGLCQLSRQFKTYVKEFTSFSGITLQGNCNSCSSLSK